MSVRRSTKPPVAGAGIDALVAGIRAEHELLEETQRKSIHHTICLGELLIEAKARVRAQVPRQLWKAWVEDNCPFRYRTAAVYMRVAREKDKVQRAAPNSLRQAQAFLVSPRAKEPPVPPDFDPRRVAADQEIRLRHAAAEFWYPQAPPPERRWVPATARTAHAAASRVTEAREKIARLTAELATAERELKRAMTTAAAEHAEYERGDGHWALVTPIVWRRCSACAFYGELGEDDPDCQKCGRLGKPGWVAVRRVGSGADVEEVTTWPAPPPPAPDADWMRYGRHLRAARSLLRSRFSASDHVRLADLFDAAAARGIDALAVEDAATQLGIDRRRDDGTPVGFDDFAHLWDYDGMPGYACGSRDSDVWHWRPGPGDKWVIAQ